MSSFVDVTIGSVDHCHAMAELFPDLAEPYYDKIASYCQQKLWHQLTLVVFEFLAQKKTTLRPLAAATIPASNEQDVPVVDITNTFLGIYHKVILVFHSKLNSLALARIASEVAYLSLDPQILSSGAAGTSEAVAASKSILESLILKTDQPATLYLQSKLALLQMTRPATVQTNPDILKEELASIYSTIKANADLLDQFVNPDTPEAAIVHSAHYEMSMTYYKVVGPPEAFYEQAIRYLNYYSPGQEDQQKSYQLAVDLCLAALTGEGVYNLGQIVSNPILKSLDNTAQAWLVELLQACALGNTKEFHLLVGTKYSAQIAQQPALTNRANAMQEKMTLLALVQMVFERPSSERTLTLADISVRLDVPLEQVEWVIMRAFSVKLMEGTVDQVDGTVHVTWVMPRVLDKSQLQELATRFGDWATKVSKTKDYMQEQNPALMA
jgi:26S proteasome regulatory subunit N9